MKTQKASEAFLDIYGTALEIDSHRLSEFQREIVAAFSDLLNKFNDLEIHAVPYENASYILTRIAIFRPANSATEFDILLDIEPSDYTLHLAGYELTSADDEDDLRYSKKTISEFLRNRVMAALEGRIKLEETSTAKGPFKWTFFELDKAGKWVRGGSISDWPVNPFKSKAVAEKRIAEKSEYKKEAH